MRFRGGEPVGRGSHSETPGPASAVIIEAQEAASCASEGWEPLVGGQHHEHQKGAARIVRHLRQHHEHQLRASCNHGGPTGST